jgi:hypothetical protein
MRDRALPSASRGIALARGVLVALLLAASCAPTTATRGGVSDRAPTGDELRALEEELAPYRGSGIGIVHGRVAVETASGKVAAVAGSRVLVLPATGYASVRFATFVVAGDTLPPAVRAAAVRQANTDAQGSFVLEQMPPGSYLVASEMFWTSPEGTARSAIPYGRFELAPGATTDVAVARVVP